MGKIIDLEEYRQRKWFDKMRLLLPFNEVVALATIPAPLKSRPQGVPITDPAEREAWLKMDNGSSLTFKSYDQGREPFKGVPDNTSIITLEIPSHFLD